MKLFVNCMSDKTKIVAIVGMAGSGKSESSAYFSRKRIPILRFGDETDIGLKRLGQTLNEKNERAYREKLRQELGMAAYAIKIKPRILQLIKTKHPKVVVLDGLYSWEEFIYLKKYFPNLILLGIYTRPEVRYRRLATRKIRHFTRQAARDRDIAEIVNSNKGGPIAFCDYMIINHFSFPKLYQELDRFLKAL